MPPPVAPAGPVKCTGPPPIAMIPAVDEKGVANPPKTRSRTTKGTAGRSRETVLIGVLSQFAAKAVPADARAWTFTVTTKPLGFLPEAA